MPRHPQWTECILFLHLAYAKLHALNFEDKLDVKHTVWASTPFPFNENVLPFAAAKDDESTTETTGMQAF